MINICNCHKDIDKFLCDIPKELREPIVKALCFTLNSFPSVTCKMVKKCETLTSLSGWKLEGNVLSISYKNEKGKLSVRSIDIGDIIDDIGNDPDPLCLMSEEEWLQLSLYQKIQAIIDGHCNCCTTTTSTTTTSSTTTTTSSTTTTTTSPYRYFLADVFTCINGSCIQLETGVNVEIPSNFTPVSNTYYQGTNLGSEDLLFSLFVEVPNPIAGPIENIDINSGSTNCSSFCPTTSTSTTTTTTCCPIFDSDIQISTSTTSTTTVPTSTTTTTTVPPTTTTSTSTSTSTSSTTSSTSTSTSSTSTSTSSTTTTTTLTPTTTTTSSSTTTSSTAVPTTSTSTTTTTTCCPIIEILAEGDITTTSTTSTTSTSSTTTTTTIGGAPDERVSYQNGSNITESTLGEWVSTDGLLKFCGFSTSQFPASQACYYYCDYAANSDYIALALSTSILSDCDNVPFDSVYFVSPQVGSEYRVYDSVDGFQYTGVIAVTGDKFGLFRSAGGTTTAQYYRGGVWTIMHTFTPTSTAILYPSVEGTLETCVLTNPMGSANLT